MIPPIFYDNTGGDFDHARRASINVKSGSALSELVFRHAADFNHSIVEKLRELNRGFAPLPTNRTGRPCPGRNLAQLIDGPA